jgi:hypothetical protein
VADIEHIKRLTESTVAWNVWRAANPSAIPDLRYMRLGPRQKQFGPISGGPINLRGALLFKADLSEASLIEADLREAELIEANLSDARLNNANLSYANLMDAVLSGTDVAHASFDGANLTGADLTNAVNLTQAQIERASGDPTTHLPAAMQMPSAWLVRKDNGDGTEADSAQMRGASRAEDPYLVLGVQKTDTAETIQSVYRRKAKKVHPDTNPGNAEAAQEFHRLTRAYSLLRDTAGRARYDRGEIGADGEETEAYLDKVARNARLSQFLRLAAMAITAGIVAGALVYGAWALLAGDESPDQPPVKVKTQGRM